MLTTRLLGVTIVIGLALAIAGVARSPAATHATGTLIVGEHQARSDLIYPEGYISFLRVRDEDGKVRARKREGGKIHLSTELAPGSYRLIRFVRPCDGNCGYLDPPTERCRLSIAIAETTTTHAIVNSRIGHPCDIEVRSGP
jgi:hypothetical protein